MKKEGIIYFWVLRQVLATYSNVYSSYVSLDTIHNNVHSFVSTKFGSIDQISALLTQKCCKNPLR